MTANKRSPFTFEDFDFTEDADGNLHSIIKFGIRTREGAHYTADQLYLDAIDFAMEATKAGDAYQMFPSDNPGGTGNKRANLRIIVNGYAERPLFFGRIVLELKAGQKLTRKTNDRADYRVASLGWVHGSSTEDTRNLFIKTVQELVMKQRGPAEAIEAAGTLTKMLVTADAIHCPDSLAVDTDTRTVEEAAQ